MKNKLITELKQSLDKIYSNIRERIDPDAWRKAISPVYDESPDETAMTVVDFIREHEYMPASSYRAACNAIDLKNTPARISHIYSEKVVDNLFEKMTHKEPLRYDYIASGTDESDVRNIMDTAEAAEEYIEKGQIYMAERCLEKLGSFFSTNPDVLHMQRKYAEVKVTGGVDVSNLGPADPLKKYEAADRKISVDDFSSSKAAISHFEKAIEDNYRNFSSYYPLGKLYLNEGDIQKADCMADMLIDFGEEKHDAFILKALVLEKKGRDEDADFYRRRADRIEAENIVKNAEKKSPAEIIQPAVADIAKHCDELIKNSRITEAYYEILKSSSDYPESTVLKFKKGFLLYLMKREPEARALMREITDRSPVYENAVNIIEDIDNNIVSNEKFDDISDVTVAEMLFNTGNSEKAYEMYKKIPENEMDARAWSNRGRCEVYSGMLNAALKSFTKAMSMDDRTVRVRELAGMIYQVKGDYDKASDLYDEAVRRSENIADAAGAKAAMLYSLGKKDELLSFRKEIERILGRGSDVDGYAGLMVFGEDSRGVRYLKKAISSDSSKSEFYLKLSDVYIEKKDYSNALICLEKGISNAEDEAEELFVRKINVLYLSGKLKNALAASSKFLERNADNAEVHYLVGLIYSDLKKEREAIRWFMSASGLDPKCHRYTYALADKCYETGDYSTALRYYTDAINLDSKDYISFKRRAIIYTQRDEDEKALADLDCAMLLKPDDPEIYVIIGNILAGYELDDSADLPKDDVSENMEKMTDSEEENSIESAEETEEGENRNSITGTQDNENESKEESDKDALKHVREQYIDDDEKDSEYYYTKAIEIAPLYKQGYIRRAKFYAENKRLDEALSDIEKAIYIDQNDENAYMVRGIIHHFAGENEKAIDDFTKAASYDTTAAQAYSYISKCCNALGKYEDGIKYAEMGLLKNPEFLNLNVNRGVAYYKLGRYNQAIEDFKKVILKKNSVETAAICSAYMFRGMAYDRLQKQEEAVSDYRMSLKYNPDNDDVRKRMNELEELIEASRPKQKFSLRRIFGK